MRPDKPYKNSGYDVEEITKQELDRQLERLLFILLAFVIVVAIGIGVLIYWIWG